MDTETKAMARALSHLFVHTATDTKPEVRARAEREYNIARQNYFNAGHSMSDHELDLAIDDDRHIPLDY